VLDAGVPAQRVYCFDNGSQLQVYEEIGETFPRCNHLRIQQNLGYSGGFNRSLQHVFAAGFSSALFCTNDTLMRPGAAEACLQTAQKTRSGMVAPLVIYRSNPDNIDSIGAYFDEETALLRHYHEHGLPEMLDPAKDYIPGTAVWIDKDTFTRLGGTDESFHMYWEDVDLCFRAHAEGIPMARCYQAVLSHGGGQTTRKKPLYTTFYFHRNRIRFCRRYLQGAGLERALGLIRSQLERMAREWQQKNDQRRINYYELLMEELNADALSGVPRS
jgi:GT2 family glycosyltransferase